MSSKLPDGFEFNAQGLVVTSKERLDTYIAEQVIAELESVQKFDVGPDSHNTTVAQKVADRIKALKDKQGGKDVSNR